MRKLIEEAKGQIGGLYRIEVLEHDDAADESDPQGGAEGCGEAEEMSQFEVGGELRWLYAVR